MWAYVDPNNAALEQGLLQEPPYLKVTDLNKNATLYIQLSTN
jgi:hypothetical protein